MRTRSSKTWLPHGTVDCAPVRSIPICADCVHGKARDPYGALLLRTRHLRGSNTLRNRVPADYTGRGRPVRRLHSAAVERCAHARARSMAYHDGDAHMVGTRHRRCGVHWCGQPGPAPPTGAWGGRRGASCGNAVGARSRRSAGRDASRTLSASEGSRLPTAYGRSGARPTHLSARAREACRHILSVAPAGPIGHIDPR
jgi:hypothetical protein